MTSDSVSKAVQQPSNMAEVLRLLGCGQMREEHGMLRWSSNYAFLVSICEGQSSILAVYKPQRGERP